LGMKPGQEKSAADERAFTLIRVDKILGLVRLVSRSQILIREHLRLSAAKFQRQSRSGVNNEDDRT
jgi:hypothetical protein